MLCLLCDFVCSLLNAYFDFERVTIHWLVNVEVYLVVARDRYENQLRERGREEIGERQWYLCFFHFSFHLQRVAIARALLKNAPILILDEVKLPVCFNHVYTLVPVNKFSSSPDRHYK